VYAVEWWSKACFRKGHTFRGVGQGEKESTLLGLRAVDAFTAPVTPGSELAAETATIGSHPPASSPVRTES